MQTTVRMENHSVGVEFIGAGAEAWREVSQLTDYKGLNWCFVNLKPQTKWDVPRDMLSLFK